MSDPSTTRYKGFYEDESPQYDDRRYHNRYGRVFARLHLEAIGRRLEGVPSGARILDVGCGTGHASRLLLNRGFAVVGLDLNRTMIGTAPDVLNHSNFEFVEGDGFNLPFEDRSFKAVVATRFVHLFRPNQQAELLAELARVAESGASVIVDFDNRASRAVLLPFLTVYNLVRYRRVKPDTNYTFVGDALEMHRLAGLRVTDWVPVGGYHLWFPAAVSEQAAIRVGSAQPKWVGQILGEQLLVSSVRN